MTRIPAADRTTLMLDLIEDELAARQQIEVTTNNAEAARNAHAAHHALQIARIAILQLLRLDCPFDPRVEPLSRSIQIGLEDIRELGRRSRDRLQQRR